MNKLSQCIAEAVGTFALIFIGIGAINANPGLLGVALAHGLTIAVMISATGHISGGHLNPAVTLGALVGGKIDLGGALRYWVSQLAGATVAAFVCLGLFNRAIVIAGTPQLSGGTSAMAGIVIEAITTFFLVFVVYGTAIDSRAPKIGGLAIGLTIAIGILFAGPLTGGAINPARVFGPALAVSFWDAHYVYWIGPMLGGALAGFVYSKFLLPKT
ncbi:MAG: aquaporin [Verrucomicrobiia bacterium]|jgi:MIP family channel proteins